jgi:hypothetical protein
MPSLFARVFLALTLCGAFSQWAAAQASHLLGVPFTATKTLYESSHDRPLVWQIARASDGSIYSGAFGYDGRLVSVEIEDVPNNRRIFYFAPRPRNYDHTYAQYTPTDGFFTESIEQERGRLRKNQQHWAENPDLEKNNHRTHFIPLGERPGNGMVLFGVRLETTYENGEKRINERWESDLGLMMSSANSGPGEGHDSHWVVTNLRREEPDPSLFRIPKEYLADPVLDANVVFLENLTDSPEVLSGALTEFNLWTKLRPLVKPLAVAKEKNAADLNATFSRVPIMGQSPITSGVKLEVYLRDSPDPVFEFIAGSSGSAAADERAAQICIGQFHNRLANTHVGMRQTGIRTAQVSTSE